MPRLVICTLISFCLLVLSAAEAKAFRPYSVKDSVTIANIGDIVDSPDGKKFVTVISKGKYETNEIESAIYYGDYDSLQKFLDGAKSPDIKILAQLAAIPRQDQTQIISDVKWSADGNSIFFRALDSKNCFGLYNYHINDKKMTRLSLPKQEVSFYCLQGKQLVYSANDALSSDEVYQTLGHGIPDIQIGTGRSIFDLLYPRWIPSEFDLYPKELWLVQNSKTRPVIQSETKKPLSLLLARNPYLSLSPDGTKLVVAVKNLHTPKIWERYVPYKQSSMASFKESQLSSDDTAIYHCPEQFQMIDLKSGSCQSLIDAPLGSTAWYYFDAGKPLWSADSKKVILPNTFIPIDKDSSNPHLYPCVVGYDLVTKKWEFIAERPKERNKPLYYAKWLKDGELLQIRFGGDAARVLDASRHWQASDAQPTQDQPEGVDFEKELAIYVDQSINQAPVLAVKNNKTKITKRVLDPNPQLANVEMGEAIDLVFKDKSAKEWHAGFIKPINFVAGKRYPLVIQTHGFDSQAFLADGIFSTANPGRALAARGIAVLQVPDPSTKDESPEEVLLARDIYVSAIEKLASDGLIDPKNVGIIGFSRTGWYVTDCLINEPQYFKAASMAEATCVSIGEYCANADYLSPERAQGLADSIGAKPWGEGLKTWFSKSPGFNLDKINVPILMEEHDPISLIYGWDSYALLRLQHKQIDLLYMRSGGHVLSKPRERFVSQETNADWFDFWLNGHEDPDQSKVKQYERWRLLKAKL